MSRKLPGSAIVPGTITVTQITGGLNDTTNASYAQANTARTTANDAYGQANTARDQANTARTQANTAYDQANNARGQANTAYGQANAAYDQANASYNVANTKLASAGGTLSGDLIITGNLTVSGNSTTLNTEILTVEDAEVVLLSNVASTPALNAGVIVNRGTSANTFLRWDEALDEWGWSDSGNTTYYFEDLRAGLATTNTTFGTVNTSLGTINTSYQAAYAQANTAGTNALNAYGQANAAYAQANSAYGAANNRVLKAGDTMTGQLNISSGGLLVTGNVGIGTASPATPFHVYRSDSTDANPRFESATGQARLRMLAGSGATNRATGIDFLNGVSSTTAPRWSILNDYNQNGTNDLSFVSQTGSDIRMVLLQDGNIGIGTTNPNNARLHASGVGTGPDLSTTAVANATAVFSNSDRDYGMYFAVSGNGNGAIQQRRGATAVYYNLLLQPHGGNVAIGTASPERRLHVYGGDGITVDSSGGTDNNYLTCKEAGTTRFSIYENSDVAYINSHNSMHFRANQTGGSGGYILLNGGNVGIGTTSPSTLLSLGSPSHTSPGDTNRILNWYSVTGGTELHNSTHRITIGVNSADTSQPQVVGMSLFNSNSTNNNWSPALLFGGLSTSGNYMNGAAGIAVQMPANSEDTNFRGGDIHFFTQGITNATRGLTSKVIIKNNGYVGIGATNIPRRLTVQSLGTGNYEMVVGWAAQSLSQNATMDVICTHDNLAFQVWDDNNYTTPRFVVERGGDVGIGTTNPTQKLDVVGNIKASGTIAANGTIDVAGDGGAGYVGSRLILRTHNSYRGAGIFMVGETSAVSNNTFYIGTPYTNHGAGLYFRHTANNYQTDYQSAAYGGAGNTIMYMAPGGNVGIGTDSPGYKLDVIGNLRITTGLAMSAATSTLYNTDGTLSFYATNNGVYLNGAGPSGWLRLNGSGAENTRNCIDIYGSGGDKIEFRTGNAERMRIHSAGYVTKPDQPAFSVYQSGSGSQTGTLTYTESILNRGSCVNLTNGRFTAPVSGAYQFSFMAFQNSGTTGVMEIFFYKNGSSTNVRAYHNDADGAYGPHQTLSTVLNLTAGDYVTVYVVQGTIHGNLDGYFSGFLIG